MLNNQHRETDQHCTARPPQPVPENSLIPPEKIMYKLNQNPKAFDEVLDQLFWGKLLLL